MAHRCFELNESICQADRSFVHAIRRQQERLLHLATLLDGRQRALLEMALEQRGNISRLARWTECSPSTLRRQLRAIIRRLNSPPAQALLAEPQRFDSDEKSLLWDHAVKGLSLRQLAQKHHTSIHRIRKTLASAQAKVRLWQASQKERQ